MHLIYAHTDQMLILVYNQLNSLKGPNSTGKFLGYATPIE